MTILSTICDIYGYLNEPNTVSHFQSLCGLEIKDVQISTQGTGTGHSEPIVSLSTTKRDIYASKRLENAQVNGESNRDLTSMHQNGSCKVPAELRQHEKQPSSSGSMGECTDDSYESPVRIRNKFLYYLFSFGAALGNEIFYIMFFPFCLWNFDGLIARRICIVWWVTMYCGQALKDIMRWERPQSPPVLRLEKQYASEYSMPSTHAMVGALIPFSLLVLTVERYDVPTLPCLIVACCWCLLVALSRVYLGMHTFLDVLVGLLLVAISNPFLLAFSKELDQYQTMSPYAIITTPCFTLLLCFVYPSRRWTTAIDDTIAILSVGTGVAVGTWINWNVGFLSASSSNEALTSSRIPLVSPLDLLASSRFLVGLTLLVATRAAVKPLSRGMLRIVMGKSSRVVDILYKYVTYTAVAINATFTAPLLFSFLNIGRHTYYSEL